MEDLLIKLVKEHDVIYDSRSPGYRDQNARQAAWEDIGLYLNMPACDAKDRWDKLRRCYYNARSRRRANNFKRKCVWRFESQMDFLSPFLESRKLNTPHSHFQPASTDTEYATQEEGSDTDEYNAMHGLEVNIDIGGESSQTKATELSFEAEKEKATYDDTKGDFKTANEQRIYSRLTKINFGTAKELVTENQALNLETIKQEVSQSVAVDEDEISMNAANVERNYHDENSLGTPNLCTRTAGVDSTSYQEANRSGVVFDFKRRKVEKKTQTKLPSKYSNVLENLDDMDMFFLTMSRMAKKLPKLDQSLIKLGLSKLVLTAEIKNQQQPCPQASEQSSQSEVDLFSQNSSLKCQDRKAIPSPDGSNEEDFHPLQI